MLVVWQVFHDMLKPLLGKFLRVSSLEATEAGKPRDGHPRGSEELTRQPGPASRRAARWPRQALHVHIRTHTHRREARQHKGRKKVGNYHVQCWAYMSDMHFLRKYV